MEKIKSGSFCPLPIVPVVLVGANINERPNYTAVGYVSGANMKPPIVCISLNKKHHTSRGITQNGTFSINIPSADYVEETDYCGLVSGKGTDKSAIFESFYGDLKTAPMIKEFPITCECKYINKMVEFAMDVVYFGEVRQVYMNKEIVADNNHFNVERANPLLSGIDGFYRTVGKDAGRAYQVGWKYGRNKATSLGDSASETRQCRIIEFPFRPSLTIRYRNPQENVQGKIAQAFLAIIQYAGQSGVSPLGAPFVAYHGMNGYNPDMEIGLTFEQKLEGKDNIQAGAIPGGKYATCTHVGPYDQLGSTRAVLQQWMHNTNLESTGVWYEFYRNDPRKTPPEKLETEIAFPLDT